MHQLVGVVVVIEDKDLQQYWGLSRAYRGHSHTTGITETGDLIVASRDLAGRAYNQRRVRLEDAAAALLNDVIMQNRPRRKKHDNIALLHMPKLKNLTEINPQVRAI